MCPLDTFAQAPPRATCSSPLLPRASHHGISPRCRILGTARCSRTENRLYRTAKPLVWAVGGIEPPTRPLLDSCATRLCLAELDFLRGHEGHDEFACACGGQGFAPILIAPLPTSRAHQRSISSPAAYLRPLQATTGPTAFPVANYVSCQRQKHDFWTSASHCICNNLPFGVSYCLPTGACAPIGPTVCV